MLLSGRMIVAEYCVSRTESLYLRYVNGMAFFGRPCGPAHSAPYYVRTAPGDVPPPGPLLRPGAQQAASLPGPAGSGPLDDRSPRPRRSRLFLGPRLARRLLCGLVAGLGGRDLLPGSDAKPASFAPGGDVIAPFGLSSRSTLKLGIPLNALRQNRCKTAGPQGPADGRGRWGLMAQG